MNRPDHIPHRLDQTRSPESRKATIQKHQAQKIHTTIYRRMVRG